MAKLLEFLLQVYEELQVCVLERACWLVPLQGAAAGCCRGVLLQCALDRACSCCCRVSLQGAAAGAVRVRCAWVSFKGITAVELGCCCRAARCAWQCGVLGLDGDYVYAVITFTQCQKAECLVAAQR